LVAELRQKVSDAAWSWHEYGNLAYWFDGDLSNTDNWKALRDARGRAEATIDTVLDKMGTQ
jgi:hypothetical protein